MEQRNRKIKKLRQQKWSYKKIGEKYSITSERVRQILNNNTIPKRKDIIKQLREEYKKRFNDKLSQKHFFEDIEILSKPSRKQEDVIKRNILIIYLYDELEISFFKIAILLRRHHTSVMYLYKKYYE